MFLLDKKDYKKVIPLIKSSCNLSVFSVLNNVMCGEVFVNDTLNPTTALIKTSECTLLAGSIHNDTFNSQVSSKLDFWEGVIPDSDDWILKIPDIHPNHFIRQYKRCYYTLDIKDFIDKSRVLPDGFVVEEVNPIYLRNSKFENSDEILELMEHWGGDDEFLKNGGGVYIRNDNEIINRSLWDCVYNDKAEIGIVTFDDKYKRKGFGITASAASAKACFKKGYKTIGWHCVETNRGSIAIAKKLGFKLVNNYIAFSTYPPIENVMDLTENEWSEWAEYLENSADIEPRLWAECLFAYIKANNVEKATKVYKILQKESKFECDVNGIICYLHTFGMANDFPNNWLVIG